MDKTVVYIGAPLFNEMERGRNRKVKEFLEHLCFDKYLPQEKAGVSYDLVQKGFDRNQVRRKIFNSDIEGIRECDVFLCLLDGRVPDEGTCVELWIAYALGKECIAYKTDTRATDKNGDNLIIEGCVKSRIYSSLSELGDALLELKKL
jgi:nucleoside 2-deoxyribosyltransferase